MHKNQQKNPLPSGRIWSAAKRARFYQSLATYLRNMVQILLSGLLLTFIYYSHSITCKCPLFA